MSFLKENIYNYFLFSNRTTQVLRYNYLNIKQKLDLIKQFTEQIQLKAIQEIASQKTKLTQDPDTAAKQDQVATVVQDQGVIEDHAVKVVQDQGDIEGPQQAVIVIQDQGVVVVQDKEVIEGQD